MILYKQTAVALTLAAGVGACAPPQSVPEPVGNNGTIITVDGKDYLVTTEPVGDIMAKYVPMQSFVHVRGAKIECDLSVFNNCGEGVRSALAGHGPNGSPPGGAPTPNGTPTPAGTPTAQPQPTPPPSWPPSRPPSWPIWPPSWPGSDPGYVAIPGHPGQGHLLIPGHPAEGYEDAGGGE